MSSFRFPHRSLCAILLAAGMAGQALAVPQADVSVNLETSPEASGDAPAVAGQDSGAAEQVRTQRYRFKDLGAGYPLELRGVDGMNSVPVSIASDEELVGARLKLRYEHSPALLDGLSHLNVTVDGRHATTIPLRGKDGDKPLEKVVELPPELFSDFSNLNLQLIGHYTLSCENPRDPSLWARVGNDSELEFDVRHRTSAGDLALLPRPFFDPRDVRALNLPFVFASQPDAATLEAAGAVASWFGAQAEFRGAKFPVHLNELPASGNAVVMIDTTQSTGPLPVADIQGPGISIVDREGGGKLLVIQGRGTDELKLAARALALGYATLSGSSARIDEFREPAQRKPYDAPRWLASDRPVSFGELASPQNMAVQGFFPDYIRVNFHMPPDIYSWNGQTVPLDLKYRATPRADSGDSELRMWLNGDSLGTRAIPSIGPVTGPIQNMAQSLLTDNSSVPAQAELKLPVDQLAPRSQLDFLFHYDFLSRGPCKDVFIDSMQGRIDPSSTIDISGLPHFIAMPDMAAFGNGGFPFTRMADLSETAVVLPDGAGPQELSAYLELLGRMGSSTGYPATHVQVAAPAQLDTLKNKDILVLSSGDATRTLGDWADRLPVDLGKAALLSPSDNTSIWQSMLGWLRLGSPEVATPIQPSELNLVMTGFESPLSGGRSVVVLSSADPKGLDQLAATFANASQVAEISGSTVVIRDHGVDIIETDRTYHVGKLGWFRYTLWYLQNHFLLAVVLGAVAVGIAGMLMYLAFYALARRRLAYRS